MNQRNQWTVQIKDSAGGSGKYSVEGRTGQAARLKALGQHSKGMNQAGDVWVASCVRA